MSREQILPPNSPELRLTRFRKRWRIVNGQYPALWFFWWGRDEHGGAGTGTAPMAPTGWDRSPVRPYPLVKDPSVPTQALYPFPGPSRNAPGSTSATTGGGGGAGNGSAMLPPGTPRTVILPGQQGTPAQLSTNPPARQEQLAALQVSQLAVNPSNTNLEARQAQFLAQQQAQARALAAAGVPPPVGYAAQIQQAQVIAQQTAARNAAIQQQQQIAMANQRAAVAQAQAGRKGAAPPHSAQSAQAPPPFVAPSRELVLDSETPNVDIFDVLTSRQLAIHRLATAQDTLLPIFDPWTTSSILAGQKRKREVDDAIRSEAMDSRTGESKGGIAGFGREHTLTILGTSAARVAVHRAMGRDATKATYPVEDRKEKLSKMLEHIKRETELMEKKHAETVAKIKASPV